MFRELWEQLGRVGDSLLHVSTQTRARDAAADDEARAVRLGDTSEIASRARAFADEMDKLALRISKT